MIFSERTREGNRQSDEHWNCFKGDIRETSERRDGVYTDSLELHLELKLLKLIFTKLKQSLKESYDSKSD